MPKVGEGEREVGRAVLRFWQLLDGDEVKGERRDRTHSHDYDEAPQHGMRGRAVEEEMDTSAVTACTCSG